MLNSCTYKKANIMQEKKDVEATIVTAKYSARYNPKFEKDGINIYFAGTIENNTLDTLYIPNKALGFNNPLFYPLEESLFYSIINSDTLFFMNYYPYTEIVPNGYARINLQRHIRPDEIKWMEIFKDLYENQTILDTMHIYYASPDIALNKEGKILPKIEFKRSKKFKVYPAEYNSYYENIFKMKEYYDNPPKQYLDEDEFQ